MPNEVPEENLTITKMERLKTEKKSALDLRERKNIDWDENYLLYRNKVKTNRLTQRQAVNIPIMKETIKTLLSKIDELSEIQWKELSGDEQKQLNYQEVWNDQSKKNKFELLDVLDKKNVLLYGLSTTKLNIDDYGVCMSILDPYDAAFDPLMVPWDIESARFILHLNIFRSVKEILADDRYTTEGKEQLKIWSVEPAGITQSEENRKAWEKKMERLRTMGIQNSEFALFAGGDRIVNLTEHYSKTWNAKEKKFEKRVIVYADDKIELMDEKLEDLIGVEFWPFTNWTEDPEINEIYPDAVADLIRVPNKVLNVWFSQLIENRTLRNFQMHWFSPIQGYTPQTYTPGPGVMLPAPPGDDINKVLKPVEVNGLDDTLQAIQQVINIVERGTGATAIEKGQPEKGVQTLGEVKILVGKATDRATAMAKFYRMAWYERAWKWDKLMHANAPKMMKLYKIGRNGVAFPKTIFKGDWISKNGYEPIVESTSEREQEETKSIQKFLFVTSQSPNNLVLKKIALKKQLKILNLSPEEMREIEEAQEKLENIPLEEKMTENNPNNPSDNQTELATTMKDLQGVLSS